LDSPENIRSTDWETQLGAALKTSFVEAIQGELENFRATSMFGSSDRAVSKKWAA
jgi:hypothetical protein